MATTKTKKPKEVVERQEKTSIAIPMAVASWLVSNTSLTFDQISEFCDIHPAIIQNISQKDARTSVMPQSPIGMYLTEEEIERCSKDKNARLRPMKNPISELNVKKPKEKKYVSMAKKRNRLDAAMWMTIFYPEISPAVIAKMVKSTSKTVTEIKKGTYKSAEKLVPKNPVVLGLCSKEDFDAITKKYQPKEEKAN